MSCGALASLLSYFALAFAPTIMRWDPFEGPAPGAAGPTLALGICAILIGPRVALLSSLPPAMLISSWYPDARGRVLGITYLPILVTILPPAGVHIIGNAGLTTFYLALAGLHLLLLPIVAAVRDPSKPVMQGQSDQGHETTVASARFILGSGLFWLILLGDGILNGTNILGSVHILPVFTDYGTSPGIGAVLLSVPGGASDSCEKALRDHRPSGTTALRLTLAAILLSVGFRIWRVPVTRTLLRSALPYGLSLGAMNLLFYMAINRIPLGVALAFEFVGPLMVATFASRRKRDFGWIALAVIGLALLLPLHTGQTALDPVGIVFALTAGVFWGSYIIMGRRAGDALGAEAPAFGMIVGALMAIPFGVADAGATLLVPHVLGLALVVALLSSAIPYPLEMFALRRLPTRTFGVLTSGEPAVGAMVGALLLDEKLPLAKWLGIVGIVAASIGTTITSRTRASDEAQKREHLLEN